MAGIELLWRDWIISSTLLSRVSVSSIHDAASLLTGTETPYPTTQPRRARHDPTGAQVLFVADLRTTDITQQRCVKVGFQEMPTTRQATKCR